MRRRNPIPLAAFAATLALSVAAQAEPLMYIPMGESNEIVVIDLATDKVVDRIGELENAHGLATSPATGYLVAGSMVWHGPGEQSGVSKPASVTEAEHEAHHAHPSGGEATAETGTGYVSIVDAKQRKVIRRIAVRGVTHHTAVSPDGKVAVAVHSDAGGISVIDLGRMAVVKTVPTGDVPNYAVFTSDGKRVYVSNAGSGTVSEIRTSDWAVVRDLQTGQEPEHMVLAPREKVLYVANVGDGTVSGLDLATGKAMATYAVGEGPHGIDVSQDGRWLFAAARGADAVTRVDLSTGASDRILLSPAPYHLEYLDSLKRLYVSSRKAPTIWVLDPSTLRVEDRIDLGSGVAHQMVVKGE